MGLEIRKKTKEEIEEDRREFWITSLAMLTYLGAFAVIGWVIIVIIEIFSG